MQYGMHGVTRMVRFRMHGVIARLPQVRLGTFAGAGTAAEPPLVGTRFWGALKKALWMAALLIVAWYFTHASWGLILTSKPSAAAGTAR